METEGALGCLNCVHPMDQARLGMSEEQLGGSTKDLCISREKKFSYRSKVVCMHSLDDSCCHFLITPIWGIHTIREAL